MAANQPASIGTVHKRVHEANMARFEGCHPEWTRPAPVSAEEPTQKKKRPATTSLLLRHWILGTKQKGIEIEVLVLDSLTASGNDYTTFRVLGANDEHAVLGLVVGRETHLRVMKTRFLPISAGRALVDARRRASVDTSYDLHFSAENFRQAAFDRPAAVGAGAGRIEPVHLIQGGQGVPLNAYACNAAMKTTLMQQVRWKKMKNGPNFTTHFQLAASDIKAFPMLEDAAGGDLVIRCYDWQGHGSVAELREVTSVMRDRGTVLPYWNAAKTFQSSTVLRSELQAWLSPSQESVVASIARPSTTVEAAAAAAAADPLARGRALTFRALAAEQSPSAPSRRGRPETISQLVLCNGQTTVEGRQRLSWRKACACKCGMKKQDGLSRDALKKRCGDDGRTKELTDARAEQKDNNAT